MRHRQVAPAIQMGVQHIQGGIIRMKTQELWADSVLLEPIATLT